MWHRIAPVFRKAIIYATLVIGAAGALMSTDLPLVARLSAQEQPSAPIPGGIGRMQGDPERSIQGAGAAGKMTYHGGPVQHTQKIFTIFWQGCCRRVAIPGSWS